MIVLTFFSPFNSVYYANGYFGTWGAFITSTILMRHTSQVFKRNADKIAGSISNKPLLYLFVASLVEIGASIAPCSPINNCNGVNAYAVALGTISAICCIIYIPLLPRLGHRASRNACIFMLVWWVSKIQVCNLSTDKAFMILNRWTIGGLIVTFVNPFKTLGNGYFSVFAAVVASFSLLQQEEAVSGMSTPQQV